MLSRVAESLYWMARYIERAEDMTRILAVNFLAQLDSPRPETDFAWQPIVAMTGDEALYHELMPSVAARPVTEFFLWHPGNPNAVVTCLTRARENARSVREQISNEMWEHLNRLYYLIRDVEKERVLQGPHDFFRQIRDGAQAFQGIATATMTHGEAYGFMQLGLHQERASKTVRILDVKFAATHELAEDTPEATLQLVATLKSCSAFEPFRKAQGSELQAWRVAEYLLLNREFPRAVAFCLNRCQAVVSTFTPDASSAGPHPQRTLGRLCADLEYADIFELLNGDFHGYLSDILTRLNQVGDDITRSFFNTQVILPAPRTKQQAAQQQQ